jgi:hypothetical protein
MIDKYVAAIVLVVSNILGLTALSKIDNTVLETEPPSNIFTLGEYEIPLPEQQIADRGVDVVVQNTKPTQRIQHYGITFKHGDVSWLPQLAAQAGWPQDTWPMLEKIILRESGGCPNRRGGDVVNKNCIITNVSEWNHRSDTGLMQINGVNYNLERNKWAAVCLQLNVCTQEPLLDPLTNLKAGKVLYDLSGWTPWDPCTWGPEWAHRCQKGKNKP